MPIFGANPAQNNLPIKEVRDMRAQGLDNNQIIQTLQRDGYESTDIFEAMNQVDMVSGAPKDSNQSQGYDSYSNQENHDREDYGNYSQQDYSGYEQQYGQEQDVPPPSGGMMPPPSGGGYQENAQASSTEELVEAIIDEKWNDLMKDVNKIVEWKNSMTGKIASIEQKFDSLKSEFDKLHQALISKIDDYDKNITNVGAEVKAMEKVFSKVLPVFTENVSELSRITRAVKENSRTKKKSSKQ